MVDLFEAEDDVVLEIPMILLEFLVSDGCCQQGTPFVLKGYKHEV